MMKLKLISGIAAALVCAAPAFSATTLDFEGAGDYNFINNYYNGGTNDGGNTGPNYGISFGPDALAAANTGNFSNQPSGTTIMAAVQPFDNNLNLLPTHAAMNVAAGFIGEASFWYSSGEATTVNIYSGLDGTGSVLATFVLAANATSDGCSDTTFCHWDKLTQTFAGVAKSIDFSSAVGVAGFDDISIAPVPLPAAAWLLMSALGGLGTMVRRRRDA